jgi:hypothetical protein
MWPCDGSAFALLVREFLEQLAKPFGNRLGNDVLEYASQLASDVLLDRKSFVRRWYFRRIGWLLLVGSLARVSLAHRALCIVRECLT